MNITKSKTNLVYYRNAVFYTALLTFFCGIGLPFLIYFGYKYTVTKEKYDNQKELLIAKHYLSKPPRN